MGEAPRPLAAADGLWERIGRFVSYCAAGWDGMGLHMRSAGLVLTTAQPRVWLDHPGLLATSSVRGETADGSRW